MRAQRANLPTLGQLITRMASLGSKSGHFRGISIPSAWRMIGAVAGFGLVNAITSAILHDWTLQFESSVLGLTVVLLNCFVLFALSSTLFASNTNKRFDKSVSALRHGQRELFFDLVGARTFMTIKVGLAFNGLVVVVLSHCLPFHSRWLGALAMFGFSSLVAMMILVLQDLEDPTKGVEHLKNIPEEWMKCVELMKGGKTPVEAEEMLGCLPSNLAVRPVSAIAQELVRAIYEQQRLLGSPVADEDFELI